MNSMTFSTAPAIGIDLGTTYSRVGVWTGDGVEVLFNDQRARNIPSLISFKDSELHIGENAKKKWANNTSNTLYEIKRLIGRKFNDKIVQNDIELWPFKVESGHDQKPQIVIEFEGEQQKFYPEEISAMVLSKMKEIAECYLGKEVKEAVITVPANFTSSQRQSTKVAGKIAGLKVLRLANENMAAALVYGLNKNGPEENVLIFDLGGGKLDVSIVSIEDGIFEVKATAGDTHLGGADFDNRLVEHCAQDFFKKTGLNIRSNQKAMMRLKNQCEKAKKILSISSETTIEVNSLAEGFDYITTITRVMFEQLCISLFKECITPIEIVLKDTSIPKSAIHDVILVGGSTRIPKINQLIQDFFDGKELNRKLNPDEAVVHGAAIQAVAISGQGNSIIQNLLWLEVNPLNIGIEESEGLITTLIPRGATTPARRTQTLSTTHDGQETILFQVYEAERLLTKDCNSLGKFLITGIPTVPKGLKTIDVSFDINVDNILDVRAQNKNETTIYDVKCLNGNMSENEIAVLNKMGTSLSKKSSFGQVKIKAKNELENLIYLTRTSISNKQSQCNFEEPGLVELEDLINEAIKWIPSSDKEPLEEFTKRQKDIEGIFRRLFSD